MTRKEKRLKKKKYRKKNLIVLRRAYQSEESERYMDQKHTSCIFRVKLSQSNRLIFTRRTKIRSYSGSY